METRTTHRRWTRILSVVALLSLTPLALSPLGRVEENRACGAGDQCVREAGSVCIGDGQVLWDHYLKQDSDVAP